MNAPEDALAGILAEHQSSRPAFIREADGNDWHKGVSICACGQQFTGPLPQHLAQVLAEYIEEVLADARKEAR
jgi:hypothetical protein